VLEVGGAGVVPVIVEASSFAGSPPARGSSYRLPRTKFDVYVVHKGDELENRLDYRIHGHGLNVTANPPVPDSAFRVGALSASGLNSDQPAGPPGSASAAASPNGEGEARS
jgi:hypothetical protein